MKIATRILKPLIGLACAAVSTAAFAQVTQVFDGHSLTNLPLPAITNIDVGTNYVGGVAPNAGAGDTAEFDGVLPGPLSLGYNGGWQSGFNQSGVILYMTANQTSPIYIDNLANAANPPNFAFNNIQMDPGAGALTIGGDTYVFNYAGRPSGAIHQLLNNSTSLLTIGSRFHMIAGGGTPFTFDFAGTGNFLVKSYLVTDNTPNNNTTFTVDTSGTVVWTPTPANIGYLNAIAAVNVNNGLLIMTTNHPKIGNTPFTIGAATFRFDAPGAAQTISGTISGSGIFQVSNGTMTLSSSQSSFFGTNLLSGGTLVVNGAENTLNGTGPLGSTSAITSFGGGVLAYSVNNTFDYSPRFDTSAGQLYKIDTAGQVVTFSNALTSAGGSLTKLGAGTLNLAGSNTYTGPTTVSAGKLVIQRLSSTAAITVADGGTLGITENDSQILPSALNLGSTAGVTLEFNNVTNKTTPSLVAGTVTAAGPITININSGIFGTIGQTYPLFSWTSGAAPAVTLGSVSGAAGSLSTNGNTIVLTITSTPYVWTGMASGVWDTSTSGNWVQSGTPVTFANGVLALFDDTALGTYNVTLSGVVQPTSITVDNDKTPYSIASSAGNLIGGNASLTMNGNNLLTLSGGSNTNTGPTTLNSGTVSLGVLASGGLPSDIGASSNGPGSLVLNGGTLQYTGPAVDVDRQFSLGTGGGTIDSSGTGALRLTNAAPVTLAGGGPRTLTLTGTLSDSNTLAGAVLNSSGGPTALTKSGPGTWILTGTNAYSGLTTINNGVLQVGVGDSTSTIGSGTIENNRGLDFNRAGTLTVAGAVTGTGAVTNDGPGTVILAGNNTYSGGTVINAGTIQIGNGGSTGSLNVGSPIIDNGTIIFNSKTPITISGFFANISGTGNVRVATGTLKATGVNSYTGWTEIDSGATFQPSDGNAGQFIGVGSNITNNGTIFMTRQDTGVFGITNNIFGTGKVVVDTGNQNSGLVVLAGTNSYTGNTWIGGSGLVLGDSNTIGAGIIVGTVIFTNTTGPTTATFAQNKRLVFNHPENYVFTNNIISRVTDGSSTANSGSVEIAGPGNVTLTGNNDYIGGTTIDAGLTLQVGNGGATGSIGTGAVVNNGTLVFNRSGILNVPGAVSGSGAVIGAGAVVQEGTGTVNMTGTNTDTGPITVSNGTLRVSTMYQGNGIVAVQDGATLSVTNAGSAVSALMSTLTLGSVAGPSTIEFQNVADPTTKIITSGALTLNGNVTIKISGSGGLVAGNTYPLIGYTGIVSGTGTFSLSLPAGVVGTLTNDTVNGWIALNVTSAVFTAPTIQSATLSGTNIVISATNNLGAGTETYSLVSSTNIATPLTNWSVLSSGTFNADGSLSITNPVGLGRRFYILRAP